MNVNWPTFIISLAVGCFVVYITQTSPQVIVVYPTPENVDRIQYKDSAGVCHAFKAVSTKCPKNVSAIHEIPVQHIK